MHPCQAQHLQWIWPCKQNGQVDSLQLGGRGGGEEEEERERSSNCLWFSVCQEVNKTPRATTAFKIAVFICAAPTSSLEWYPQYPDTKPQEGEVPASAGSRTGKLFILGASLCSESCFDWKIGHSFLADLCCQQSWHATQFLPAPFLHPHPLL